MSKKFKKKEKIDFLLENRHYRKLHLYLYFLSLFIIVSIYFLILEVFSSYSNILITGIASILIGIFLVYNRNKVVKFLSEKLQDIEIKKRKKKNKEGLKSTLTRITPKAKRNIKLSIGGKTTIRDRFNNFKSKLNSKGKKPKEYIEIK